MSFMNIYTDKHQSLIIDAEYVFDTRVEETTRIDDNN